MDGWFPAMLLDGCLVSLIVSHYLSCSPPGHTIHLSTISPSIQYCSWSCAVKPLLLKQPESGAGGCIHVPHGMKVESCLPVVVITFIFSQEVYFPVVLLLFVYLLKQMKICQSSQLFKGDLVLLHTLKEKKKADKKFGVQSTVTLNCNIIFHPESAIYFQAYLI